MMVYHFQTKFRDEPRVARRADPRPRVRHEGRLQLRPRRGRPRRELPRPVRGLRADVQAARARRDRGRRRRRDHGRHRAPTSSWSSTTFGEDTLVLCDSCGYAENQQIAEVRKPDPEPEDALPMEDVETPGATTIDDARGVPGRAREPDGQGRVLRRPATAASSPRSSAATTTSTRRSSSNAVKATGGLRPATVEEITAARDGGRLRLADRGDTTRSSSSTSSSCARRTSSPARTASAGT